MEPIDAFAAREPEFLARTSSEAKPADANPGSFTPYHTPWFASVAWGALLCAAYPLLVVTPLAVFAMAAPHATRALIVEIGVDCAVVAFTILALQFVIATRLRWVEAPFGLDVILQFHRTMAFVAMGLLCIHPLLIASGASWHLLTRWRVPWSLWVGRLALILSRPPADWAGRVGRLDIVSLRSLCGGFADKAFFICCPPLMASGLIRGLRHAGVAAERIHADYFGLQ